MARGKRKFPPAPRPWPCVVLGIDPGKLSGWAVLLRGKLFASGTAKTRAERLHAVEVALEVAEIEGLPLVVVAEKWTAGGRFAGARSMAGLGASWGRWEETLDELGAVKSRRFRVHTQTWRAATIGGPQRKSEAWKAAAVEMCMFRFGVEVGPDEAEAILVALWGAFAGLVGRKLPKRSLRAADMERFVA